MCTYGVVISSIENSGLVLDTNSQHKESIFIDYANLYTNLVRQAIGLFICPNFEIASVPKCLINHQ